MLKKLLFLLVIGLTAHTQAMPIGANNAGSQLEHGSSADQEIATLIVSASEQEDLWNSRFNPPPKQSKKKSRLYFAVGAIAGAAVVALCLGGAYWYALHEENKLLQNLNSNKKTGTEESDNDERDDKEKSREEDVDENGNEANKDKTEDEQVKELINDDWVQPQKPDQKEPMNEKIEPQENHIDQSELKVQAQQKVNFICSKMVEKKEAIEKKYEDLQEAKQRKLYQEQYSYNIYTEQFFRASKEMQDQRIKSTKENLDRAKQTVKNTKEEIKNLAQEFDNLMNERMDILMDKENKFKGDGRFADFIDSKSIANKYDFSNVVKSVRTIKRNLGLTKGWLP